MRRLTLAIFTSLILASSCFGFDIDIIDYPVLSQRKLDLMKEYSRRHYGMDTYQLWQPKMIVLHYTVLPTLRSTIKTFSLDEVPRQREKLRDFGRTNVGSHYVIDYSGEIYNLVPTTVMVRHVIGFNHVAISIENVGSGHEALTKGQLEANAKLIRYLTMKHPSIEYVIGHIEYMMTNYGHYKYYKQNDKDYEPHTKIDPGFEFMRHLRRQLKEDYNLEFKN
jgi:N-acetyl-anhydromuramyl-L-alanine amidase AmpD